MPKALKLLVKYKEKRPSLWVYEYDGILARSFFNELICLFFFVLQRISPYPCYAVILLKMIK